MGLKNIAPDAIELKPFQILDKGWALLSAGKKDSFNTMTVSWGSLGTLWNKPVVTVYVRPQRFTREFIENEDCFTLSFLSNEYKSDLTYLGKISGRGINKLAGTKLTAGFENSVNAPIIEQASLVLVCKKLYYNDINKNNFYTDELVNANYPQNDFHRAYTAHVIEAFVKE